MNDGVRSWSGGVGVEGAVVLDDIGCDVPSRGPGYFLTDSVIMPSLVLWDKI